MVRIGAALFALLLAAPAPAAELALVIGNEDYENVTDVAAGDVVVDAASDLEDAGVEVIAVRNAGLRDTLDAIEGFAKRAPRYDRLLVVLSGVFVSTASDTYFLPVSTEMPPLYLLPRNALPLSVVTAILDNASGNSVIIMASDSRSGSRGPFLDDGMGALAAPARVGVVRTDPARAARIVRDVLADPRASVARGVAAIDSRALELTWRQDWVFLSSRSDTGAAAARSEKAAWDAARGRDTEATLRSYLDRYPRGDHALEARLRIEALRRDPVAIARRDEESLSLSQERRQQVQRGLALLGYDTRGIDGIFGDGTRRAIGQWQKANELDQTGYLTGNQIALLARQSETRRAQLEREAAARREQTEREDRAWWLETGARGTERGYREYLERFPDGRYAEMAHSRLDWQADSRARSAAAYEREIWDDARAANSEASYRAYLEKFPNGAFAVAARDRVDEIERRKDPALEAAQAAEAQLNLNPLTARLVEERLTALGMKPGTVDGTFDSRTRRAIRRFQDERGLTVSGHLDQPTVVRLLADTVQQLLR